MTAYQREAEIMRNVDLTNLGLSYFVNCPQVDDDARDKLESLGYDDFEEPLALSYEDVEECDLWDVVDPIEAFYSEVEAEWIMGRLIKSAPYYLVFAHNCRWNGASGYTFTESPLGAIRREYEASIYPLASSKGGKALLCLEYSHDVPTGAHTMIIALTEKEYAQLNGWNATDKDVCRFVDKHEKKLIA